MTRRHDQSPAALAPPMLEGVDQTPWHIVWISFGHSLMFTIALGAIFDTYLLMIGGSKLFVGSFESARGMVSLLCSFPLGVIADRVDRALVLRWSAVLGAVATLLLVPALLTDSRGGLLFTISLWAVYDPKKALTLS